MLALKLVAANTHRQVGKKFAVHILRFDSESSAEISCQLPGFVTLMDSNTSSPTKSKEHIYLLDWGDVDINVEQQFSLWWRVEARWFHLCELYSIVFLSTQLALLKPFNCVTLKLSIAHPRNLFLVAFWHRRKHTLAFNQSRLR